MVRFGFYLFATVMYAIWTPVVPWALKEEYGWLAVPCVFAMLAQTVRGIGYTVEAWQDARKPSEI